MGEFSEKLSSAAVDMPVCESVLPIMPNLNGTLLLLYSQGTGVETNLFSTGDVYAMPDYPDLPRAAHKKFINTVFNAPSKEAAAKSIASATCYWDIIEDKPVYKTYSGKQKRIGYKVWPEKPLAAARKYIDLGIPTSLMLLIRACGVS